MKYYFIKYILLLLLVILIQKTFIWVISISKYNITPDLVIIVIIYIGIKKGHIEGSIYGFLAGLVIDILSGSFLGLMALCYSVTGFISAFFMKENEKYLNKHNFLFVIFFGSVINNLIYYIIYFQGTGLSFADILLLYVFTTAAYTSIISIIYILIPKKKSYTGEYASET